MLVGYVRSAHGAEVLSAEGACLRDAGCELIFADLGAGASAESRPELGKALDSLRPQDVLLVTGLDRLAGDLRELIGRMVQVQAKGASVRTLGSTSARELLDALLSFEKQSGSARKPPKPNAAHEPSEANERPRLLDDAATRLVATRAQAGEPAPPIARKLRRSRRTESTKARS